MSAGRVRDALAEALRDAGGTGAPPTATAQLRDLLLERLGDGAHELERRRSGRQMPVCVGVAAGPRALVAVAPVEEGLRADPACAPERAWLLVAALVGALVEAGDERAPGEPALSAGSYAGGWLALSAPAHDPDPEIAAVAFDEQVEAVDRLRAAAFALPPQVLEDIRDLRPPIGHWNQLRIAEALARLGGRPADSASVEEHEEALLAALPGGQGPARPHDDPVPARRVARRILQTFAGKGKWGGYHTEFDHVARGFEGNDRRLALEVGEELVRAGLLAQKQSVGQRHVFLNPRRAQEIYALVDEGVMPPGLRLG